MIKNKIIQFIIILFGLILFLVFVINKVFDRVFYNKYVQSSAIEFKLDPALIFSVISEESRFNNSAASKVGAVGLMQIMPKTSKEIANELGIKNFDIQMLGNPEINIRLGSCYLKKLIVWYDGNLILALSAYNAGIGIVEGWLKNGNKDINTFDLQDIIYKSTRISVYKVIRNYRILMNINKILIIFRPDIRR